MRVGRRVDPGFLPIFSVCDEEEAAAVMALAVSRKIVVWNGGDFISPKMAAAREGEERSLKTQDAAVDKLFELGEEFVALHDEIVSEGRCRCRREDGEEPMATKRKVGKVKAKRTAKRPASTKPPAHGPCYNCKKDCDKDEFCHGCHEFTCSDCAVNDNMPWGPHDVSVHFEEPEESYDD